MEGKITGILRGNTNGATVVGPDRALRTIK
jgi:hypothetical protein